MLVEILPWLDPPSGISMILFPSKMLIHANSQPWMPTLQFAIPHVILYL